MADPASHRPRGPRDLRAAVEVEQGAGDLARRGRPAAAGTERAADRRPCDRPRARAGAEHLPARAARAGRRGVGLLRHRHQALFARRRRADALPATGCGATASPTSRSRCSTRSAQGFDVTALGVRVVGIDHIIVVAQAQSGQSFQLRTQIGSRFPAPDPAPPAAASPRSAGMTSAKSRSASAPCAGTNRRTMTNGRARSPRPASAASRSTTGIISPASP